MTNPIDELAGLRVAFAKAEDDRPENADGGDFGRGYRAAWNHARGIVLATLDSARSTPVPTSNDRPDFEKVLREADAAMRDEMGRQRSRTSYYWRDLAAAIYAVWDKGHPDLRSGLTELGTDLARAITDELPVPASNVSGLYEDERALWEFIDHGKSPASNAAKGLDLPRCVVDHDHEADEGPCVYSVPASNVSEGPREAQRKIVSDWLMRGDETGKLSSDELLAALAHAAPEGLCAICKRPFDHKTHQPGIFYHHPFSQPDATEEAG